MEQTDFLNPVEPVPFKLGPAVHDALAQVDLLKALDRIEELTAGDEVARAHGLSLVSDLWHRAERLAEIIAMDIADLPGGLADRREAIKTGVPRRNNDGSFDYSKRQQLDETMRPRVEKALVRLYEARQAARTAAAPAAEPSGRPRGAPARS